MIGKNVYVIKKDHFQDVSARKYNVKGERGIVEKKTARHFVIKTESGARVLTMASRWTQTVGAAFRAGYVVQPADEFTVLLNRYNFTVEAVSV